MGIFQAVHYKEKHLVHKDIIIKKIVIKIIYKQYHKLHKKHINKMLNKEINNNKMIIIFK